MTIRCPLCENEIMSEIELADGQHVICPNCQTKFTFYLNAPVPKPAPPLIISSGEEFESFVCDEINTLACATCEMTKTSGDQGVDLVVTLENGMRIAIQCKLYSTPVGNAAVQEVVAGKMFYDCDVAAVVSNNGFTASAERLAAASDVALLHFTEVKEYVATLGEDFASKDDKQKEISEAFFAEHPTYIGELVLHARYKARGRFASDAEDVVYDLVCLFASLEENGRRMMGETARLVNVLLHDVELRMMSGLKNGHFGKTLSRIYETYKASGNVIDCMTLDDDGNDGLKRYVRLYQDVKCVMDDTPVYLRDPRLRNQIFKDELPLFIRNDVESDFRDDDDGDDEWYEDIAQGRRYESILRWMTEDVSAMFGTSWDSIVEIFGEDESAKRECL